MAKFSHTPYAGPRQPFTIGLTALDRDRWIEPDDDLLVYLAEKRRLLATRYDDVFQAEQDSQHAQGEAFALLTDHLHRFHPATFAQGSNGLLVAGQPDDPADSARPPLVQAGLLVQDDLVILQKTPSGWQITAAHLSFPSSWVLGEKFGRPMDEVHAHVPGFGAGTRNALVVNRIFDNLLPDQPAERFNWSINWQQKLFHPESGRDDSACPAAAIVRVERQTLTKLPQTGALLFTIRIYLDPLRAFAAHPDGKVLADRLADQLAALQPDQATYKGLDKQAPALIETLRRLAAAEK